MAAEFGSKYIEGADVPTKDVEMVTDTSSIGGFGEPKQSSFFRLKGIHQHFIESNSGLDQYLREFYSARNKINSEFTRVQHRGLIHPDLIHEGVSKGREWVNYIESIVPLNNDQVFIYLSYNSPTRQLDPLDKPVIMENLSTLDKISFRPYRTTIQYVQEKGYEVCVLNYDEREGRQQDETIFQLYTLYERFGWEKEDVRQLCVNQNNTIGVVRHKGKIVSAGIAERANLRISDQDISIVEITEAATDAEHINRGLYSAVSASLLLNLSQSTSIPDVTFGECNTLSRGVLIVAKSQGRLSAMETMRAFGINRTGELVQQVPINDPFGVRHSRYNNLMPMSITREELLKNVNRL